MKIINPDAYKKATGMVGKGKMGYIDSTDFEIPYCETKPIEGYKPEENFPNCCNFHQAAYRQAVEMFDKFPNCCDGHKKLNQATWFTKSDYSGIVDKTVNTIGYTQHHISKQIEIENWYEDITNYLQYSFSSFGQFPTGYGNPLGLRLYIDTIMHYIEIDEQIPAEKGQMLADYIAERNFNKKEAVHTDINILIDTYQKWLKTFPFEISYFKILKEHFEKQIPIIDGGIKTNPYTGLSESKTVSQLQLIKILTDRTKMLLKVIDSDQFIKDGVIVDINKHTIDLLNESHRIKQSSLLDDFTNGERGYIKILKRWLSNEKDYFKEFVKIKDNPNKPEQFVFNDLSLQQITKQENQFWKGIRMDTVVNHFKVFTERNSKNGKPFLTEGQFIIFLKKGFLGDSESSKQKINLANGEKGFVIKRFYDFFELAVSQYGEVNKKFKYIKLLTTCFDNWDSKTIEPFFKPNKTKESW